MAVGAGVHHFEVGPVVGLPGRSAWHRGAPPEVHAGRHEDFGVGDLQAGLALELHDVQPAEGVDPIGTSELKAVPSVVGHVRRRHDLHALFRRRGLGAGGAVLEDHGARGGVHNADVECDVLAGLSLEEGVGAHVALGEVQSVNEDGAFRVLPVNPGFRHLVAGPVALELAVVAGWPDGVGVGLPGERLFKTLPPAPP